MNFKKVVFSTNNLEILQQDDDIMIVSLRLLHTGRNDNKCDIPKYSAEASLPTFYNKPIVYKLNNEYFPKSATDVDDHSDDKKDMTMHIAGSIIESGGYKWVKEDDKEYLEFIGIIHKVYQPVLVDIIKNRDGNLKVSIEIKPIRAYRDKDEYLVIEKFKLLSVCLLGKNIREGIANSRLNVVKFSSDEYNEKYLTFQSKYGTKSAIKIDKSKDSVSFDTWGDVDKTELRHKVLEAKNYKTLIKSVYLEIGENWEKSPSTDLSYPVMQIKDGKAVYNRYGISSALGYAKGEDNQEIVKKAEALLEKLEIKEGEKMENEVVIENSTEEVVVEEVVENSEITEEITESFEMEEVEVEETEVEEEKEDEVDYKSLYEELKDRCEILDNRVREFERMEEKDRMRILLDEYAHCYSDEEKSKMESEIETSVYSDFEQRVNEKIKEFAKGLREKKVVEEVIESQTFSSGFEQINDDVFTKTEFSLEEYVK